MKRSPQINKVRKRCVAIANSRSPLSSSNKKMIYWIPIAFSALHLKRQQKKKTGSIKCFMRKCVLNGKWDRFISIFCTFDSTLDKSFYVKLSSCKMLNIYFWTMQVSSSVWSKTSFVMSFVWKTPSCHNKIFFSFFVVVLQQRTVYFVQVIVCTRIEWSVMSKGI